MMNYTRLCAKCVLPDTTPYIDFDEDGVCNYCREYVPMTVEGEERLVSELVKFRNRGEKYDCMVCISGGRDSTYTLWKIVNDYKMRALALTYNSPFLSRYAKSNVEKATAKLKVDRVEFEFPNDAHRKTTQRHMKIWARKPSSQMIPFVCAHCKSWNFNFYQIAKDNKIPLIVFGSNPLETASFKKHGFGGARTYGKLQNLPKLFLKASKQVLDNPMYLTANWRIVFKMYLGASHSMPYLRWKYSDISAIRLFDYLKWNEAEVENTIKENLGWQKSPEVASSWRFDCRLDYVRRVMYANTIGVTELRDLFSKMIREGMLTREDALKRLEIEEPVRSDLIESVLSDLNLNSYDLHFKEN